MTLNTSSLGFPQCHLKMFACYRTLLFEFGNLGGCIFERQEPSLCGVIKLDDPWF
jgi:hypothetical protein